ncbi:hypothetical protein DFH06DRAFT_261486 [Mycena polygramma]|nr:hypothetical protein DFH06DRAFT_261486 [Mycena polygramma]
MTCVPDEERIKPLPLPKDKNGNERVPKFPIRYANPETLGFKWIKPRPETFERCGRDITRFVLKGKKNKTRLVGGVRYRVMYPKTLEQLLSSHRSVTVCGVRRRAEMERWNYGTMTGEGPRQPMGGLEGDFYGPYACHSGNTPDAIRALFRQAVDNDILVEIGSTIIPSMRSDIKYITQANETLRMGRYGLTSYTCSNYISAIHPDYDVGAGDVRRNRARKDCKGACYPCVQLELTGVNKEWHEWDFVVPEFSLVIETHGNTVWNFNGIEDHGSSMPSQSSIDNNAVSLGKHPIARRVDGNRAKALGLVRHGMKLRPRV